MLRLHRATIQVGRSATIITPWTVPDRPCPSPQRHTMPNPSVSIHTHRADPPVVVSRVELLRLPEAH